MSASLLFVIKNLIKYNEIRIDEKELEFQLLSHPSYPSLHSLTGVLNHFNIENAALEIPKNSESVNALPEFFIAHIKDEKTDELVLASINVDKVQIVFDNKMKKELSIDAFIDSWTGVILVVEKSEVQDYEVGKKKSIFPFALYGLILMCIIGFFLSQTPDLYSIIHYSLSILGLIMSIVIVKHELGFHSVIADKFCSGKFEKIDCNKVLESKGSGFLNVFKFSDIGIIYFGSIVISWLLLMLTGNSINLIKIISVLAIPFTIYSIIYQAYIVRKWCTLCLSIVTILWLQAISLYYTKLGEIVFEIAMHEVAFIGFSFIAVTGSWIFIYSLLKKEQELKNIKINHRKFKLNYSLFEALINRSSPISTSIEEANELVFGNKNGALNILIVTNPLCSFCKETHTLFKELITWYKDDVLATIRFNVNLNDEAIDNRIAMRLLELNQDKSNHCLEAMNDIYGFVNPVHWLEKWGEPKRNSMVLTLNSQKDWCNRNKINFTPELLVNGKSFPKEYERMDLLEFIEEMIDEKI